VTRIRTLCLPPPQGRLPSPRQQSASQSGVPRIRPNILKMEPYAPDKPIDEVKRELGLDRVIKLASNENPLGPSPRAVEAVREAAGKMHLYPDGAVHDLKQAIACKLDVPLSQILVGNGSDELIHLLGLLFLGSEEDELIMGHPSFSRYDAAAELAPSRLVKVPLDEKYRHDLPAMAKAVTDHTRLIFIANPNNPTGTIVRRRDLDAFLSDVPDQVTVVLDEAYYEFAADEPDYPSSLEYIAQGHNVVGLRTFSKDQGLAGIRVGYGFASPAVVDAMNRAREPFDVNSLAQVAAIAALQDDDHVRRTVENNRKGLKRLANAFVSVGAKPMESYANFVFADFGRPAHPVFQDLLKKGVITRSGQALGNENCLRVSVGTPQEIEFFERALQEVLE
jgi:histidinol-phosphate aminotransferase